MYVFQRDISKVENKTVTLTRFGTRDNVEAPCVNVALIQVKGQLCRVSARRVVSGECCESWL